MGQTVLTKTHSGFTRPLALNKRNPAPLRGFPTQKDTPLPQTDNKKVKRHYAWRWFLGRKAPFDMRLRRWL